MILQEYNNNIYKQLLEIYNIYKYMKYFSQIAFSKTTDYVNYN